MNNNTTPKYTLEELEALVEKRCTKCKKSKPLTSYTYDRKTTRDGHRSSCADCESKRHKERRKKIGPDEIKNKKLLYAYNITLEQYNKMLQDQDHRCAICGRHEDELGKNLFVDHDHNCCPGNYGTCGKCVRGLLCDGCNRGIGSFRDNADIALNAVTYLLHFANKV